VNDKPIFLYYDDRIFCFIGEKPSVAIYDLHSLRKRKILSSPDIQSEEYISLAFSPDSKYLATQSASPDWTLLYWTWEKAKVMASVKTNNPSGNSTVTQVLAMHIFVDNISVIFDYCQWHNYIENAGSKLYLGYPSAPTF